MARKSYSVREKRMLASKVALTLLLIVVVVVVLFMMTKIVDRAGRIPHAEEASTEDRADILVVDGVKYKRKTNLMTYLFLGIDASEDEDSPRNINGGLCDVLQLVVIDNQAGTYYRLPINRNTWTDITVPNEDGSLLTTTRAQIGYAYSQIDDDMLSIKNAADTVSMLLYDQPIDKCCSVRMGAISSLNHLVGGATVTIEDDFSEADPSLRMGETIHLTDEQAEHYIHDRMNVGDGTNEGRMRRQDTYLDAVKPVLIERCREDNKYALEIYDTLDPYMVTDMSRNDFIKLAAKVVTMEDGGTLQIEGTSAMDVDDEFMAFTPDEDSLEDVVLQLFYDKLEGE